MLETLRSLFSAKTVSGVVGVSAIVIATPFIATWEGKSNSAYLDRIASPPKWTVCYGHTGKHAYQDAVYSDAECVAILESDVGAHYEGIKKCMSGGIPVSVQASLLELAFNTGVGNVCNSTMMRKANSGDYIGACRELDRWVKAGGKTIRGLVNRRNASYEMCMKDL